MRIIGGKLKGLRLHPPSNLPVRPTTDRAKEALMNILMHNYGIENMQALDLFAGTGNISLEFASHGIEKVLSVDINHQCIRFIKNLINTHGVTSIQTMQADAFKFLTTCNLAFDLIFADPPYDHPKLSQLPLIIFQRDLLKPKGIFILEHAHAISFNAHPYLTHERRYGHSSFSFFENT